MLDYYFSFFFSSSYCVSMSSVFVKAAGEYEPDFCSPAVREPSVGA